MLAETLGTAPLEEVRNRIYLGDGYFVLRNFVHAEQAIYMLDYWRHHNNPVVKKGRFDKTKLFHKHCPNYTYDTAWQTVHFNFFWNPPSDTLTYDVAWRIQRLRNNIEGNSASDNYLAISDASLPAPALRGRVTPAASYRVVGTLQDGALPLHRDWIHDPSKVQMSLVLSSIGKDYKEGGFLFRTRDGRVVNLSVTENLKAGDLVVFRYCYEHGVAPIVANANQIGFWRMLFPIESLYFTQRQPAKDKRLSTVVWLRKMAAGVVSKTFNRKPNSKSDGTDGSKSLLHDMEVSRLAELAIASGVSPSEVFFHKGLFARWHMMQRWQFDAVLKAGLQKQDKFLDIGCGVLRLGLKLIEHLDHDCYFGTDPMEVYVRTAQRYAHDVLKTNKRYRLVVDRQFDFGQFAEKFDFAMAHSVFTHMTPQEIERCFRSLKPVMVKGGKLLFTLAVDRALAEDRQESFIYNATTPMVRTHHANLNFLDTLSKEIGVTFAVFTDPPHPSQTAVLATF